MCATLWKILLLTCLGLVLVGCSVEPGGSEEPADFKTELTPAQAETSVKNVADAVPTAAQDDRLDALEQSLQAALGRIDTLESSLYSLQNSVAAIEMTASQALLKAEEGPLAGLDFSDQTMAGKKFIEQSLEQIIGLSEKLLEKMEEGPGKTPAEAPQETAVEVQ